MSILPLTDFAMEHLLTIKELSEFLQLSQQTIYKLIRQGVIHGIRIGNQWRFDQKQIEEWIYQKNIKEGGNHHE